MHKIRYFYKGKLHFSSHDQITDLIIKNNHKKVLDIGCNEGFIGKALRDKGWRGLIVGIDKNKIYKTIIRKGNYYEFININVENGFKQIKNKFNAVVFADVLEHLNDPLKVLIRAKKIINKNGRIYISLPNIANIFIRTQLFFGKFTYLDYGILDKDHRWFFTHKSAQQLIDKAGLRIIEDFCTPIPAPFLSKNPLYKELLMFLYFLARLLSLVRKEIFAYQFIFVCRKK